MSKLDFSVGQFGQNIKPSLTLERLGRLSNEGHGFSRVPMSLRLTQGDENHLDSPIMILRGLEVVFDCAVKACLLDGFSR